MHLEAVTVCVGYADYLRETAPLNKHHFDRWVIVTSPRDRETLDLCHELSLTCLITDDFTRDQSQFNKGRGIQRGINNISCKDWVVHIDADVALPHDFPHALKMAHLDPSCIYGCDRMMVWGWDAWQAVKASGYRQHGRHCYVLPHDRYVIGARWASPTDGYAPIGFFQLWHGGASIKKGFHQKPYPHWHSGAARSDVQFALQWDRRQRVLIPELLVWHLETAKAPIGGNWAGRTTPRFGPKRHHPPYC